MNTQAKLNLCVDILRLVQLHLNVRPEERPSETDIALVAAVAEVLEAVGAPDSGAFHALEGRMHGA